MHRNAILLAPLALLPAVRPASAADPAAGDLAQVNDEVAWAGGPFELSNPVGCLGAGDPTCDHFTLTVSAGNVDHVAVAIAPDPGFEADDYDLFVYDDQGALVATDASGDGYESVVFAHTGSAFYEVRVQPWSVTPGSTYTGVATRSRAPAMDDGVEDCLEVVPAAIEVLDLGQPVELSALVLLDGTDRAVAEAILARAADAYAPLNVDLTIHGIRQVTFTSTTSDALIEEAKAAVGGVPPRGADLVVAFTDKSMQNTAGDAQVVGQADCIGGIRWPEHSFAVVSDIRDIEQPTSGETGTLADLGLNPNVDATAEVMAHEIGHLMGAHHHYANCVEGTLSSTGPGDLSPCTLMFNAVNFASIGFSTLSGAVVRGHAVQFADD